MPAPLTPDQAETIARAKLEAHVAQGLDDDAVAAIMLQAPGVPPLPGASGGGLQHRLLQAAAVAVVDREVHVHAMDGDAGHGAQTQNARRPRSRAKMSQDPRQSTALYASAETHVAAVGTSCSSGARTISSKE